MPLFQKTSKIIVTCPKGIAPYLKEELEAIGFQRLTELTAGVETTGTIDDAMQINLSVRTAHRVLYLLEEFSANSPHEMYKHVSTIPWEDYLDVDGYFSVTSTVENPTIKNTQYANVKCKDAIVDRFYKRFGRRPQSGPKRNRAVVHLFWKKNGCSMYLDTSGEPLSRHGYRTIPLKAPMQETLAAATLMATRWKGTGNFINPMCGSGTLAIEAALIALKRPPGLFRNNFGFMYISSFDKFKWKDLRNTANRQSKKTMSGTIVATDINPEAVAAATKNAESAGVDHLIDFHTCDFSETPVPEGPGIVFINPEYGERLGDMERLKDTYKEIGTFFKQQCLGYRGYIFTGNFDLAKRVGLKTKRRIPFYNSNIECRLLEYDLYEGSRKPNK